jgi:hypothetical protein
MKKLYFLFPVVMCLIGCADKPVVVTEEVPMLPIEVPGTQLPISERDRVRNDEQVRNLQLNPYVDPNNKDIRHDGHDIQVLEKNSTWNLKPSDSTGRTSGPIVKNTDSSIAPNPMMAELEQELSKQRDYTRALLEQSKQSEETVKLFKEQNDNMKAIALENTTLKKRLEENEEKTRLMESNQQKIEAESKKSFWQKTIEKFQKPKE